MTSKKTKAQRLKQGRLLRAQASMDIDTCDPSVVPPPGALMADPGEFAPNNTYGRLPRFYIDKIIHCRQCGAEEIWPAENQKWWYEVVKGSIYSEAVLCRACREQEKLRKDQARRIHREGLQAKRESGDKN